MEQIVVERRNRKIIVRKQKRIEVLQETDRLMRDEAYSIHAFDTAHRVATEVEADIHHHFDKYGPQRLSGLGWIAVVTEEWGETVQAYLKKDYAAVIKEGKQTIACVMRLLAEVEREERGVSQEETQWYTEPQ